MASVFELTFSVKKILMRQDTSAVIVANNLKTKNTVIQRHLSRTMRVSGEFRKIFEKDTFSAMAEIKLDPRNGTEYIELQSIPTLLNPENEEALVEFLCSRINRLGKKNATAIVDHLKLGAVNKIIANESVLLSIPNFACTPKRAAQIASILRDCATIDQIGIFIQSIGLPLYIANDIYKKYENNSMRVIHTNPYSICYDGEISFKAADQIAEYLQFDVHNPVRVQTAIISFLNYVAFSGHTCFPRDYISGNGNDSLNNFMKFYACMKNELCDEEIDDALRVLVDDKKIHIGMNLMGEEYVYLYHYFSVEQNVVYQIKQLLEDKTAYCDESDVIHFLNNYTNSNGYQLDPLQKDAVLTALSSKIMILTGGPGTGKTATVNMIVQCIEELTKEVHGRVPLIKLLAPTGKAAERMSAEMNAMITEVLDTKGSSLSPEAKYDLEAA
jgi:exodeoxyribonuclease V alpha subunit